MTKQFFSGNASCQQIKSPQHFHEFFPKKIFDNVSREIKVVNSKKVQNRSIFTNLPQNNSTIFLGKSKLNFWIKNEGFEQCIRVSDNLFWRKNSKNTQKIQKKNENAQTSENSKNYQKTPKIKKIENSKNFENSENWVEGFVKMYFLDKNWTLNTV